MAALLHDGDRELMVSWRYWRPTVALFSPLSLFNSDQMTQMFCNLNVEVAPGQALAIAEHIEAALEYDADLIEQTLSDEPSEEHPSVSEFRDWLMRFSVFCRSSNGFKVG